MKAVFEVRCDLERRTVFTRLQGIFSEDDMRAWAKLYREKGTTPFRDKRHMVLADMRGMKPTQLPVAQILGDEIGHARKHGVVLCAHISDHTVQRLQALRVARENSTSDEATVDVDTLDEANRVLDEARNRLDDKRYTGSIRDSL